MSEKEDFFDEIWGGQDDWADAVIALLLLLLGVGSLLHWLIA